VPPLTVTTKAEYERTPVDATVQEEIALERGNSAQREAMRLDRAGRFAESRTYLRASIGGLAAAPQSARVMNFAMEMQALADADETIGYGTTVHKQVTYDAMRRSRGKQDES
jgi:hypothetical protein